MRAKALLTSIATVMMVAIVTTVGSASSNSVLLTYLQTSAVLENDLFEREFPYDAYLADARIGDLAILEEDRRLIEANGLNGDAFLLRVFARYLDRVPADAIDIETSRRTLEFADRAIAYGTESGTPSAVYETIGYMFLDNLAARVERGISSRLLVKDGKTQYLLKELSQRGYVISLPTSRVDKLIGHVKSGDWRYIADRAWKETVLRHPPLYIALAACGSMALILGRLVRRGNRTTRKGRIATRSSTTVLLLLVLIASGGQSDVSGQALTEEVGGVQYYNSDMSIRRLYYNAEEVGSAIWLKRGSNKIRARYFASGQVYQKFVSITERIILACAGAFTDRVDGVLVPEGLTVENGTIINRNRNLLMDGLVIVYATGGIAVSDLETEYLDVQDNGATKRLDLLKSEDKTYFLNWAQQNKATVFQTQLLASSRGLRLNVTMAQREIRERRLLAIVQDSKTNEVAHIVFNITKPFYLGPITKLIHDYLQRQSRVVGLLNLDTGDYNILQVNAPTGETLAYLNGPRPIKSATNLLVYYYARD